MSEPWTPGQWIWPYCQILEVLSAEAGFDRYVAVVGDAVPQQALLRRYCGIPPREEIDRLIGLACLPDSGITEVREVDGDLVIIGAWVPP